jgi:N-acyl-D-amino-acid deacylase
MPLETAIQKMTSLAAENVGIKNRGLIAPGYFADLVSVRSGDSYG